MHLGYWQRGAPIAPSDTVERMTRTLLDERFRIQGRIAKTITQDEIQRDLDRIPALNVTAQTKPSLHRAAIV